jgi:hypothetical protein
MHYKGSDMFKIIKIVFLSLMFVANAYAAVYTNWRSGEPSDPDSFWSASEDCAVIYASDGTWNDRGCAIFAPALNGLKYACYNGVSWSLTRTTSDLNNGNAHSTCQELGDGYYFSAPFNAYENEQLRKAVEAAGVSSVWLNAGDWISGEGNWVTNSTNVTAVAPPYITRWAGTDANNIDEPDGNDEDCGSMDYNGYWYDEPCDVGPLEEKRYLCADHGVNWFISDAKGGDGRLYAAEKACRSDSNGDTDMADSTFSLPNSDAHNESVRNTIRGNSNGNLQPGEKIWINFNDRLVEGEYKFDENRYFWNEGEPNSASESCVVRNNATNDNRGWNDVTCSAARSYACYRHATNTWQAVSVSGSTEFNLTEGIKACQDYDSSSNQYTFWSPKDFSQHNSGSAINDSWLNIQWDTTSSDWQINRDATHWGSTIVNDKDGDGYNVNFRTIPEPNNGVFPSHVVEVPALNVSDNEDCASQQGNGSWYDLSCLTAMKFACYDSANNDWRLAPASVNATVYSGENACQSLTKFHEYHFAAPGTRQQQTDLALEANKVAIWVNATDRTEEKKWRYNQFLTFWAGEGADAIANPEQPEKDESKDCAIAKGSDSALWYASSCTESHQYLCNNAGSWNLVTANTIDGAGEQSGQEACNSNGLFLAPNTLSEQQAVSALIGANDVWINASDVQIEETWKINELQFWDAGQPTSPGDCAVMKNSNGLWISNDCATQTHKYLCFDTEYGGWVESILSGTMEHFPDGQNACEAMNGFVNGEFHEFVFAAPIYTWENDAAANAISEDVWINGNDRITPNLWVFNEFLYWSGSALNPATAGDNDCLVINNSGNWQDISCDTAVPHKVACYSGDGWYLSPTDINITNFTDAQRACNAIGNGYRFFSPVSVADNRDLRALIGEISPGVSELVWINGIDIAEEGKWVFNSTGLPTPNWASTEPHGKTLENCAYVDSNGLWYDDVCSGPTSVSKKLVCKKLDGSLGISVNSLELISNFDDAQSECNSFSAGATFYAPTTFNENEELRQLLPVGEKVWVNASDNYIEARWALNIASVTDYDAISPNTAAIDGCAYYDDQGKAVASSCNTQARAVACSNGQEWKVSNNIVLLGTSADNGTLIRNAFAVCQQEFSGDYTFAVPSNADVVAKWELSQALALSGKASAWLNMADWFVNDKFSSNMPYQNVASNPVQANTGCAYTDGAGDGWLIAEQCDAIAAHFACFNGSVWKVAPANGTIDEPAKPQSIVDAWDQSYGDLRCREYFGQSYNFSAPITPKEDADLKQVISRLDNTDKQTWINYYSNRLWNGLNGQQWFADRINLNVVDGIELDQNATTEDCGSITKESNELILRDEICSITKNALCFEGSIWSKTTAPSQWNKASAQCGLELGEQHVFAIPRDSLERSQVDDLLSEGESLWVNYSDLSVENKWRANIPVRQWWADSEPTNLGNRDCVVMGGVGSGMTPGEWRSDYCDQVFHQFACKRGTAWQVIGLDGLATSAGGIWAQGFSACRKIPDDSNGPWHFDFPEDYFANLATATTIAAGTADTQDFDNGDATLTTALVNTTAWLNLTDQYREKDWQRGRQFSDWAASFAFDDNKDCAFVDTEVTELNDQSVQGTWQPGLCFASDTPRQYACTNGLNWTVADAVDPATGNNWLDGFDACAALAGDWTFAAPVTSFDNERLKAAIGKGSAWINLQDVSSDGDWAANLSKPNLPPIIKFLDEDKGNNINETTVAEQSTGNNINLQVIDPDGSGNIVVAITQISTEATITSPTSQTAASNFSFTYSAAAATNTVKALTFKLVATDVDGLTTTTFFNADVIPAIIAWYDFNDANKPNFDKTGNENHANDNPELPYDFPPVKNGAIDISSGSEKMTVDGVKLAMPADYAIALRIWADGNDDADHQDFQIKYPGTEKCFDLPGVGATAAQVGNSITMYACEDASDQHWYRDDATGLIHSVANDTLCLSHVGGTNIQLAYCSNVQHPWTINPDGSIESDLISGSFLHTANPPVDDAVVVLATTTPLVTWATDRNIGRGILQKGPVANQPLLTFGDTTSYLTYAVGDDFGTTEDPLKEEQWVNVIVNVVGNQLTLFVDGVKENTSVTITPAANDDDLIIGDIPSALRSFIGRVDDVQVFSRPLTDIEVLEILPEPPVGLVQFESSSIVRQEPQIKGGSLINPVIVRRTDGSNGQLRAWYKTHEKSASEIDDYIGLIGNEPLNELVWKSTDTPLYLTPEYDLLPLLSSADSEDIDSVELDRTAPLFVAIDLSTIPVDPAGILWEQGGSGTGTMIAFNAAHELVIRAGNGQIGSSETARFVKDKTYVDTNLVGKSGTLFVSIDPSESVHSINAWFKEGGLFGELPIVAIGDHTSASPFPNNEWQGGDAGMLGNINNSLVLGEFSPNTPFQARYIRNTISGSDINGGVHWVEIQAFDAIGITNLALGVTDITTNTAFVRSKDFITNGNLDSTEYSEVNGTENTPRWVQIDLGSIETLSSINVRHYSVGTRLYYDNKTEYSEDGTSWTTIADFTSAPYVETSAGKSMDEGLNANPGYDYNGVISMGRFYNQVAPDPLERIVENAKLAKITLLNESPFDREPTERFDLELINTERRATDLDTWAVFPEGTTGYLNQTEVTLLDYTKNPQGIMQFSRNSYECAEPYADDNQGTADYAGETRYYRDCSVEVQRRTGDQDNISVQYGISARGLSYTFAAASVTPLTDVLFASSDLKLTFASGVRTQSINFRVIAEIGANNRFENDEEFGLTLFNPLNIDDGNPPWLGDPIAATVVSKDYAVGTVNMPKPQVTLTEPLFGDVSSHIQTIDVRRSGGGDGIAIVDVALAEVSIDDADYDLVDVNGNEISSPVRLTWLDGQQSSQPIFIKIYSDRFQEFTSVVQTTDPAANCYDDPADSDDLPDDLNRDCVNGDSLTLTLTTVAGSKSPVDDANKTTTVYVQDNTAPAVIKFTADTLAFTTISEAITVDTVDVGNDGIYVEGTDTVTDRRIQPKIERSNGFAEHAVWLYIRGVDKSPAIAANFVGVNSSKAVGDRIYRGRDLHDAWIQTPYVRDGGFANEYRHLWVLPMAAESNIANAATINTTVTSWNAGTTSSNIVAMTDSVIGSGFQVHPTNAKGKNIDFSWAESYQGGRVVYHNRTDCCRPRISDARIDFYQSGGVVHQFEFSSVNTDVNEITITIPENIEFDQMRFEFSSAGDNNQNFREIQVFSRSTTGVSDVHSIDVVLYDNDRADAQNRNIEFRIEAASERDDRVIDLGSAGSNSTAEFTDIEIVDENLPPEFIGSTAEYLWPRVYGSGMTIPDTSSSDSSTTVALLGARAPDRDWINVKYTVAAISSASAATGNTNAYAPTYWLKDEEAFAPTVQNVNGVPTTLTTDGIWQAPSTGSTITVPEREIVVRSAENGAEKEHVVEKKITVQFKPNWHRMVVAGGNECIFKDGGSVTWGYGGVRNCDGSDEMYWAAIPQGTSPQTYQLINKSGGQCLYKNSGNGSMGFRTCAGGAVEQWIFETGSESLVKRDGGATGTRRYVCGIAGGDLDVRSGACSWDDVRWR